MRICHMQRFSACLGVGAMLVALLTAPLYHFHDRDDHGNPASLVHAHFLESEEAGSHSGNEIETPHSHRHARWIEFFTFQAPPIVSDVAIDLSEKLTSPVLEKREKILIALAPRAHSPPSHRCSVPRSPPTV
jgi:ABC-type Zn2+ transport system substrate-binding protein/surface adhesin